MAAQDGCVGGGGPLGERGGRRPTNELLRGLASMRPADRQKGGLTSGKGR